MNATERRIVRQDDDGEDSALWYGQRPGRMARLLRWLRRWGLPIGASMVLAFCLNLGLDHGYSNEVCTQCGARSKVRHLSLFGIGSEFGREVFEGRISKLIQEHDGSPCAHLWRSSVSYHGNLLWREVSGCLGHTWYARLQVLETGPSLQMVLEHRCKDDEQFPARLKKAIQQPSQDESQRLLWELQKQAWAATLSATSSVAECR